MQNMKAMTFIYQVGRLFLCILIAVVRILLKGITVLAVYTEVATTSNPSWTPSNTQHWVDFTLGRFFKWSEDGFTKMFASISSMT